MMSDMNTPQNHFNFDIDTPPRREHRVRHVGTFGSAFWGAIGWTLGGFVARLILMVIFAVIGFGVLIFLSGPQTMPR